MNDFCCFRNPVPLIRMENLLLKQVDIANKMNRDIKVAKSLKVIINTTTNGQRKGDQKEESSITSVLQNNK